MKRRRIVEGSWKKVLLIVKIEMDIKYRLPVRSRPHVQEAAVPSPYALPKLPCPVPASYSEISLLLASALWSGSSLTTVTLISSCFPQWCPSIVIFRIGISLTSKKQLNHGCMPF
jgi:hypothetical protein